MHPHHLLPLLSLLLLHPSTVIANPDPAPLDGQAAPTTQAPTPMATTTVAGSLFTIDGTTTATWKMFTQTFAATALGSWDLGPTPKAGSIGLGAIEGSVGGLKTKREVEDKRAVPTPEFGSV